MKNKNKTFIVSALLVGFFVAGCTGPTQKYAVEFLDRGRATDRTVVVDLVSQAEQSILDKNAAVAAVAATNGDAAAAQKAVLDTVNELRKVHWLHTQHERAQSAYMMVDMYLYSQVGVGNLIWKDLVEAKRASDAKDAETP